MFSPFFIYLSYFGIGYDIKLKHKIKLCVNKKSTMNKIAAMLTTKANVTENVM